MAIDFPASPTVGQQYTYAGITYTYSAQSVWVPGTGSKFNSGTTAPSSPNVGDFWYDLSTGILSIYIDDGNSKQWVQVSPVPTTSGVSIGDVGLLTYVSTTALKFAPYKGNQIKINGTFYPIPNAGIAGLGNTNVFVNGAAAQNLAASTTYWVFAFVNASVVTADFRTAATHATSLTAGNEGVEILTGDDTRSLIGMCRTNASSQFQVDSQNIGVLSWFNKRPRIGQGVFTTVHSLSVTTPAEINAEIRVNFLSWFDPIELGMGGAELNAGTAANYTLFAVDGTVIDGGVGAHSAAANYITSSGGATAWTPSAEGWHTATLYGAVSSGTGTWYGQVNPATLPGPRCSLTVRVQG